MEQQFKILCGLLLAIYHYGKNIHHQATGEAFQAMHELADIIANNKYDSMNYFDYIDAIKEELFAGSGIVPPLEEEFIQISLQLMPQFAQGNQEDFVQYLELIKNTVNLINQLGQNIELGDSSRLGDLAKYLKQYAGLVFLQVRGYLEEIDAQQMQQQATAQQMQAQAPVPPEMPPMPQAAAPQTRDSAGPLSFIQRLAGGR